MTKEEVLDYIFVNTNQYFVGIENFEIKEPILDKLLQRALNIYSEYKSVDVLVPIKISSKRMKFKTIQDEFGDERTIKNITGIYMNDWRNFPLEQAKENFKIPWNYQFDKNRKVLICSFGNMSSEPYYIAFLCHMILDDITDQDVEFLDLITALAYIYIGHNRNDFALSELPFDITDLRDTGQTLLDETIAKLKESGNSDWWKAIDV